MKTAFLYCIIIFLVTRLIFQSGDKKISLKRIILKTLIEGLCITVLWSLQALYLIGFVIAFNFMIYFSERKNNLSLIRFMQFLFLILSLTALTWNDFELFTYHRVLQIFFKKIQSVYTFLNGAAEEQVYKGLLFTVGFLFVMNEVNNLVRFILHSLKVEPLEEDDKIISKTELKRGKIIGIIERILLYIFAAFGNFTAIGFILAAKGFTRFKELDDRNFAEYVLIGTLLSTALSIIPGLLIRRYL